MKRKYRIKSKFRFTIFIILSIMIIGMAAGTAFGADEVLSMDKKPYKEILVMPGDTLWDLAVQYGPSNTDTRRVVYSICQLNDITADNIQPGQVILVPAY